MMTKIKSPKKKESVLEETLKKLFTQVDKIERLTDMVYELIRDGKSGIFSAKDALLIFPIELDRILLMAGNCLSIRKGEKLGIFSIRTSSVVLPIEYDKIAYLDSNLFEVTKGEEVRSFNTQINLFVQ